MQQNPSASAGSWFACEWWWFVGKASQGSQFHWIRQLQGIEAKRARIVSLTIPSLCDRLRNMMLLFGQWNIFAATVELPALKISTCTRLEMMFIFSAHKFVLTVKNVIRLWMLVPQKWCATSFWESECPWYDLFRSLFLLLLFLLNVNICRRWRKLLEICLTN